VSLLAFLSEQALGPPLVLTGKGGLQELVCFDRTSSESSRGVDFATCELDCNTHESHFVDKGRVKGRGSGLEWPWLSSKEFSRVADLLEPLSGGFLLSS